MTTTPRVYIVSAARTAIGAYGGSLKDIPTHELAATAIKASLARSGVDPAEIDEVILGCVNQVAEDAYVARSAALTAGLPSTCTAYAVNRICSSGAQAFWSGVQAIQTGGAERVIAGGVESLSRLPYYLRGARWGYRLGHDTVEDGVVVALTDPLGGYHMGTTAERLATMYAISRETQDEFAYTSHMNAVRAVESGLFDQEITPVQVPQRRGEPLAFSRDEQPRSDTSIDALARLRPVFKSDGSVTAGNASPLNDGAAAGLLMSEEAVKRSDIAPLARIVGAGVAGVEPDVMGYGPVPSTAQLLERMGLTWDDIDLVELNEAFAAQALAVLAAWPADVRSRVNVNGGAIALGHPLGATGAILITKLAYELRRRNGRYGLVTLCVGGGQGFSLVIERA